VEACGTGFAACVCASPETTSASGNITINTVRFINLRRTPSEAFGKISAIVPAVIGRIPEETDFENSDFPIIDLGSCKAQSEEAIWGQGSRERTKAQKGHGF
jgi:hypothetical protein